MNKVELLAPAGDLERLKWAILYGADAVYIGYQNYSLRANAKNFSLDEIKEGVIFAHKNNAKVYVTVNIIFHQEDIKDLEEYLIKIDEYNVDAIISSDIFILDIIKKHNLKFEFHLSTQMSTLNSEAALFFKKNNVKRIVLGRETSKNDIKNIIDKTNMDLEVFIHGAMCMAYSGRCTLSNYLTNRDSNRGGCAQICRWVFDLYDEKKLIDKNTKFSFSPKDQSLLKNIRELIDLGVKSFKIEGRMKSVYYLATIVSIYRKIIDNIYNGNYSIDENDIKALYRCANRDTTMQYFDKKPTENEQYYIGREENTNQDFLGVVLDYDEKNKEIILEERNYFKVNDKINIFGPKKESFSLKVEYIKDEEGNKIPCARHPKEVLRIPCTIKVSKNDLIRIDFFD